MMRFGRGIGSLYGGGNSCVALWEGRRYFMLWWRKHGSNVGRAKVFDVVGREKSSTDWNWKAALILGSTSDGMREGGRLTMW